MINKSAVENLFHTLDDVPPGFPTRFHEFDTDPDFICDLGDDYTSADVDSFLQAMNVDVVYKNCFNLEGAQP